MSDYVKCEWCGDFFNASDSGFGVKGQSCLKNIYCSLRCYNAALKAPGTEAYNYVKEKEEIRYEEEHWHDVKCKQCGKTYTAKQWLKVYSPGGICFNCFEKNKAEKERAANEKIENAKAERKAILSKCVNIDGAYYSLDKTTLFGLDKTVRRLTVLDGVVEIAKEACKECTDLKSVTLPESLEEIEEEAFSYCSSLTEIKLPKSLKKLKKWAFACSGLKSIDIPEGIEEIGETAFVQCKNLESATIPASVKKFGPGIFMSDESLKEVSLPEGMTEIPNEMFKECSALSEIKIPSTVKKIGIWAFKDCTSLTSASVQNILNQVEELAGGAFTNTGVTEITIPANIKTLGSYQDEKSFGKPYHGAFTHCSSLKSVTIAEGKGVMGRSLFFSCESLENVSLPSTLKSIGSHSFYLCKKLTSITLPEKLEKIGISAFDKSGLTSITLPESVIEIGKIAFLDTKIKELRIPSGVTKLEDDVVPSSVETLVIPSTITELSDEFISSVCVNNLQLVCVEGNGLSSEIRNKLKKIVDNLHIKDNKKTKIKTGDALGAAKNAVTSAKNVVSAAGKIGSGLSSMFGNAVSSLKENEQVQNTLNETKDALKKAFGGLFGKK